MRFGVWPVIVVGFFAILVDHAALAQSGLESSAVSTGFCDRTQSVTAIDEDRILRFAAVVREELSDSSADTVIISRSGLDLSRFHLRYSHAAILSRPDTSTYAWTARQLYFACDEGHPRIFDQGLAGFAGGSDDLSLGYLSVVVMPFESARLLREAAQDNALAVGLLGAIYSANAYPFSTRYQNCNQWVMEMLAVAWGQLPTGPGLRQRAQQWLTEHDYDPEPVAVRSSLLMLAPLFTPMLHLADHPDLDRSAMMLKVSLPSTIEAFIKQRLPDSERIEFCHTGDQVVVHHGWTPIEEGCHAAEGDRVVSLL